MSLSAPAVRHPVVQRGDQRTARPALPRVRHQAVPGALRRRRSARPSEYAAGGRATRGCSSKAGPTNWSTRLRSRMTEAAAEERFEQAAQLRDAVRTVETLRDRQQKMASVELGDRDVFGVKTGPAGAVDPGVPDAAAGGSIERVDLRRREAAAGGTSPEPEAAAADVLQAAVPQFYEDREVPPEIHVPVALAGGRGRSRRGSRTAPGGGCGSSCRSAARSAACSTSPRATPPWPTSRASTSGDARQLRGPRDAARGPRPAVASRAASSASTSRPSRAARPSPRWSSARTAG